MKGCVEQWPNPADPTDEIPPQRDWEEGGNQLQLLRLLDCVYKQWKNDPVKVVVTDAIA